MTSESLTIGITTRDRPKALLRCLDSLRAVASLAPEVLVFDDASVVPVDAQLAAASELPVSVRVLRDERGPGYIAGRNRLVREANESMVLLLDDDAALFAEAAVRQAMTLLGSDPQVAAVAFAQADRYGKRWPLQPGSGTVASYVPAFIGFAHLLKRDVFLALGGYRERLEFYGEEKDFCLRLLDAGYRTVYLPDALVMHEPDPGGRNQQRYLRYVTRNDCFIAVCNEPLGRVLWVVPARLLLYYRMRRDWDVQDAWGWAWILRELLINMNALMVERRPVSKETLRLWRRLRRAAEPYIDGQRVRAYE